MRDHFRALAGYNIWANQRLYDAAAALSDEEYRRDVGAFFTSRMGTLNHVLVADRVWMKRFTGEGDHPARLDAVLHEDLAALRAAREAEDERIASYIENLGDAAFEGRFTYTTVTDLRTISQRLAPALDHFFNHQTHHRGQAHGILSMLGKEPPVLDLIFFFRQPEGREFA
ncbi:MAG: DinB family protein [Pararhizobium sp.]